MNRPARPCLKCRALFIPDKDNPSYCLRHKPIKKRKYRPQYNDPEFRKNRKYLIENVGRCSNCGTRGTLDNKLEIDHIIPISKGGTGALNNLRILCYKCHRLRHLIDKTNKTNQDK